MPPGNRGDIGHDQDGKKDGSWWGSNESANDHGGSHNTLYGNDDSRASWDTDNTGDYVKDSGHTVDDKGNIDRWDDKD